MNTFGKLTIAVVALATTSCASAPSQSPAVNVTG